jgi:tight adherence protein B
MTRRGRAVAVVALSIVATALAAPSASAAEAGRIIGLRSTNGTLTLTFQADGLADGVRLDPASVEMTVNGRAVQAHARSLAGDVSVVQQIAILAVDNSRSMAGSRLSSAKAAADTFIAELPPNVKVGLVTFADVATTVLPPTADKAAVRSAVDGLTIKANTGTALFDGASEATTAAGPSGARSVLLLTDGNETGSSAKNLEQVVTQVNEAGVALDAVYINPDATQPAELVSLVTDAGGQVVPAGTANLADVFRQAADAISNRLEITANLAKGFVGGADVAITARAGTTSLSDTAFTTVAKNTSGPILYGPQVVKNGSLLVRHSQLPWVFGALFLGLLIILLIALSTVRPDDKSGRLRRRLSLYTLAGRQPVKHEETTTVLGGSQVARSAVEFAGRVARQRDFEAALDLRLEAAGLPLRAAEWMLIHLGIAIGLAILALLLSGGGILPTVLGLLLGLGLPWGYLLFKESRRTAAFLAQLPDTLQLTAGSLSAGYSMAQAIDTVVRENQQPMSGELNRALVEARLGVPLEDALEGIAERMRSKDFAWVVMAIRIQREVGGNLAELLTTVSGTLRERERLRRQVQVLSAEGRLSAWILGLLPIVFTLYLALVRPSYLKPLFSEALGWLMLSAGATLLVVGALWLRKAVKVEV